MTHNELVEVWASRHSWPWLLLLKNSARRNKCDTLHDVVYITVSVFLHATGASGHPTTESRELTAVGLMSHDEATELEVSI